MVSEVQYTAAASAGRGWEHSTWEGMNGHAVANGTCRVRIYVGDTRIGWMHLDDTKGLWGRTKERDFVLPKTDTVRFVFPPQRGVAVKWIELKAKGNAPPTAQDDEPTATPARDEDDPRDPSTADGAA